MSVSLVVTINLFFFNVDKIGFDVIKDVLGGGYTLTFGEKELIIDTSGNMKVPITFTGPICLLRP